MNSLHAQQGNRAFHAAGEESSAGLLTNASLLIFPCWHERFTAVREMGVEQHCLFQRPLHFAAALCNATHRDRQHNSLRAKLHPPEDDLAPKAVPHKRLREDFESAEQGEGVLCGRLHGVWGGWLLLQLCRLSMAAQVHQQHLPGRQALQAGWGAAAAALESQRGSVLLP